VDSRLRAAALCSIITMVSLAGAYVYQNASLQLPLALGLTATVGIVGALFGWRLAEALRWASGRIAQQMTAPKAGTVRDRGAPGVSGRRFP
jgi:hypothetical protein